MLCKECYPTWRPAYERIETYLNCERECPFYNKSVTAAELNKLMLNDKFVKIHDKYRLVPLKKKSSAVVG